jgi:MFS family permease
MFSMQLPFMLDAGGMADAGSRSLIQSIPGIGVIAGGGIFGILHHRIGAIWTLALSSCLFGLGLLLIATNHAVGPLAVGAAGTGLCMGMSMPYFYHAISERVGHRSAGRYLGYLSACSFFGVFANPILFEPAKALIGVRGLFVICAAVVLVMGLAAVIGGLRQPRVSQV